jgi:Zn-dependent protease with chaperone function
VLWILLVSVLGMCARTAHADGIVEVLYRSQQARLESLPPAPDATARTAVVRQSFQQLIDTLGIERPVGLQIISGLTVAETVHGDVVVANEFLAGLPEGERLFILAHEIGHVVMGHWGQVGLLFQRYVPGEVTPEVTNAVANDLGRDASALAHQHEFDADAFALRALRRMGFADTHAGSVLARFDPGRDTATHPGTRRRMAALMAIDRSRPVETARLDSDR